MQIQVEQVECVGVKTDLGIEVVITVEVVD